MKKSINITAMFSLGLGLLSVLPGAQAESNQTIAVAVSAHVQSKDFNVSAVPGSVWLAAGSSSRLASNKEVSLTTDNDPKKMTLEVTGAGVSNKSIKLEAAKGKSLQAMVFNNKIYNAAGTEVPLDVKINNIKLNSEPQDILANNPAQASSKIVLMDVSATSDKPFDEGDYQGTMTVVFSAGA